MLAAHLSCSLICRNAGSLIFSVCFVITTMIMSLVKAKSVAVSMGPEGLNEVITGDSEELMNSKTTTGEFSMNHDDWTMVDFLLCLAGLIVIIVCVVFCYFLGVFEACKRRSGRTGDDQYDGRTIRGKGFAGCAGCID